MNSASTFSGLRVLHQLHAPLTSAAAQSPSVIIPKVKAPSSHPSLYNNAPDEPPLSSRSLSELAPITPRLLHRRPPLSLGATGRGVCRSLSATCGAHNRPEVFSSRAENRHASVGVVVLISNEYSALIRAGHEIWYAFLLCAILLYAILIGFAAISK